MIRRTFKNVGLAFAFIVTSFIASPSFAEPINSSSVVYFDAADNIIGQWITYCDANMEYAGTVVTSNPYRISEFSGCGDATYVCNEKGCKYVGPNYSFGLAMFNSATGATLQDYCNAGGVVNDGSGRKFAGGNCTLSLEGGEPTHLGGLTNWTSGHP